MALMMPVSARVPPVVSVGVAVPPLLLKVIVPLVVLLPT